MPRPLAARPHCFELTPSPTLPAIPFNAVSRDLLRHIIELCLRTTATAIKFWNFLEFYSTPGPYEHKPLKVLSNILQQNLRGRLFSAKTESWLQKNPASRDEIAIKIAADTVGAGGWGFKERPHEKACSECCPTGVPPARNSRYD
jgi:hypothetical protein